MLLIRSHRARSTGQAEGHRMPRGEQPAAWSQAITISGASSVASALGGAASPVASDSWRGPASLGGPASAHALVALSLGGSPAERHAVVLAENVIVAESTAKIRRAMPSKEKRKYWPTRWQIPLAIRTRVAGCFRSISANSSCMALPYLTRTLLGPNQASLFVLIRKQESGRCPQKPRITTHINRSSVRARRWGRV
jgi:hypothetical protein